jgi:hypothetical protein
MDQTPRCYPTRSLPALFRSVNCYDLKILLTKKRIFKKTANFSPQIDASSYHIMDPWLLLHIAADGL